MVISREIILELDLGAVPTFHNCPTNPRALPAQMLEFWHGWCGIFGNRHPTSEINLKNKSLEKKVIPKKSWILLSSQPALSTELRRG